MNLLRETIEILANHNKTPEDVLWVGCSDFKSSWDNFKDVADIEYDSGYGGQEVAADLIIMGNDFWMERHEYDGSEWWEFKMFINPKEERKIVALTTDQAHKLGIHCRCGWDDLSSINGYKNEL